MQSPHIRMECGAARSFALYVFLQLQAIACSSLQTSLEKLTSVKKLVDTRDCS